MSRGLSTTGASSSASLPLSPTIEGRKAPASPPPLPSSRKRSSPSLLKRNSSTPTSLTGSGASNSDIGIEDQDDPLLSLFRVHNTKRVNFDLTPQPEEPEYEPNGQSSKDSGQASGFLRKLVKGASRRRKDPSLTASVLLSKKGAADVTVEEDEVFINSMLETTPLRRVSSFLSGKHWSNILRSNSDNPEGYSNVKSQGGCLQTSQSFSTIDGMTNERGANGARTMSRESKESLARLLKKAKHAHKRSFRYRAAVKYYLLALKEMAAAGYTESDPLMQKIVKSLNDGESLRFCVSILHTAPTPLALLHAN